MYHILGCEKLHDNMHTQVNPSRVSVFKEMSDNRDKMSTGLYQNNTHYNYILQTPLTNSELGRIANIDQFSS